MTKLELAVYNTMPTLTLTDVWKFILYFDMPEDALVMHYMGEPTGDKTHCDAQ